MFSGDKIKCFSRSCGDVHQCSVATKPGCFLTSWSLVRTTERRDERETETDTNI